MRVRFSIALSPLALAACGPAGNDTGPGGVTVDEARALDEAAQMLDARRLPDETPVGNAGSETTAPATGAEPS